MVRRNGVATAAALACGSPIDTAVPLLVAKSSSASARAAFVSRTLPQSSVVRIDASALLVPRGGDNKKGDNSTKDGPAVAPPFSKKKGSSTNKKKKKKRSSKNKAQKDSDTTTTRTASSAEQESSTVGADHEHETSDASPHPPATKTAQEKLVEELLQYEDYYQILGVSKTASSQQIQKAYRRRAVSTHPDKMPDHDRRAFDKVAEAYDVLSDDSKRQVYDRFGKRGLDPTHRSSGGAGFPHSAAEDMFRSFFGGTFGSDVRRPPPQNRSMQYQLEVSLEDLYGGMTRKVVLTDPSRKTVEVHVPRGMATGQSILLSGEVDHVPHATPADLIFTVVQRSHPVFTRKGHDLAMEVRISLQEALCGVTRTIRHLNGRSITVSSALNNSHAAIDSEGAPVAIHTGDVQVLKGEGMPKPARHGHEDLDTNEFGDLYVQFLVEMPSPGAMNRLSAEERKELEVLLAKLEGKKHVDASSKPQHDVRTLKTASSNDFGRASGRFRMEQDEIPSERDERRSFNPFGGGGRQFYWSSAGAAGNPFSSSSASNMNEDDPNVQCQQM